MRESKYDADSIRTVKNEDLIPDAGKISIDPPKMWGRGMIEEAKATTGTYWMEEMTNFNQKTFAVTILMFITVIAPTLAFGAVFGKVTDNHIGTIETIMATAWVGILYSLIGGMPTCIIGATVPVLAFIRVLYKLSESMAVPFPALYGWVSVWVCIFCLISAFIDNARLIRVATRFTDDIFALLIVFIFVMDALGDPFSDVGILKYFDPNNSSHDFQNPDYDWRSAAFLSTIAGFGTTWLIFYLRGIKLSSFCCSQTVRTSIHDFSVIISALLWAVVVQVLFPSVNVETLKVPSGFEPSFQCCDSSCTTNWPDDCPAQAESYGTRPWFADMTDFNGKGYVPYMAAGPAILAFVLIYLDNGITWHLIYHPSHKIRTPQAYNYDLVLSGFFNLVNGLLGLPWLVATTVPSMIHLNALAEKNRDGMFISVDETRLTYLLSHILVGCVLFAFDLLKHIPVPVLYGVFLFMGLVSLPSIQFWNRILMIFQQPSKWTETPYTKYVDKWSIHKYTVFETFFFLLIIMFFALQKTPEAAILFPFMIFVCIPARLYGMPKFFEGWEIVLLDGIDTEIEHFIAVKENSLTNKTMGGKIDIDDDLSEEEP